MIESVDDNGFIKEKHVYQVNKNDYVRVVDKKGVKTSAKVLCVVEIELINGDMAQFNNSGLSITKTHPVW